LHDYTAQRRDSVEEIQIIDESLFHCLFDNAFEGILIHKNGIVLDVNEPFASMFGYEKAELVGKNSYDLISMESVDDVKKKVVYKSEDNYEAIGLKKDGTTFEIEINGKEQTLDGIDVRVSTVRNISIEKELQKNEKRFRSIVDTATDAIFMMKSDGSIASINPAAEHLFGYCSDEILGLDIKILMPKRYHEAHTKGVERFIDTREPFVVGSTIELDGLKKDGTEFPIELSLAFFETGKDLYFTGIIRDISERKIAEDKIKESENRYRILAESAEDDIFIITKDMRIRYVNPCAAKKFNVSPESLVGKEITKIFPEQAAVHMITNIEQVFQEGRSISIENSFPFPGREVWLNTRLLPLKEDDENITAVMGVSRDITARKKTEEALWVSEQQYRTLVESTSECICKLDLDGTFKYMSPAGLTSHGMKAVDEVIGKHCQELAEPQYHDLLSETLANAKDGQIQKFQYESETIDGVKWFESVLTPQKDNLGNVVSIIRISRDITDRVSAEKKIRESWNKLQKTLEDTVAALSSTAGLRDPYTASHQQRVAKLASAIATQLGLAKESVKGIRVASTLHDIGKIYVPAEILSKPGKLNEFEFKIIESHAQASHDILKDIDFPWPIAKTVLQHHERLNGSGYPNKLSSDEILIEAKILAVADVVEAMSSRRPYRSGLGIDKALAEISDNKGSLYDDEVASTCISLFTNGDFDFRGSSL